MQLTPREKKIIPYAGAAIIAGIAVLVVLAQPGISNTFLTAIQNKGKRKSIATSSSTFVAASATPSGQQTIDTGLSLSPASSTSSSSVSSPTSNPQHSSSSSAGCALSLAFTPESGNPSGAGVAQYQLAAKNIGGGPCTGTSISVYYAGNESFSSSTPKATADGYYWQIGTLAAGAEYDIALTTNRAAPGAKEAVTTDEACLSASNGSDACANAGQSMAAKTASAPQSVTVNTMQASSSVIGIQSLVVSQSTLTPQSGKELGVWEWTDVTQMSSADMQNIVNEASANNFNVIYLTVDYYLTIANMPESNAKQTALANYDQSLQNFLTLAQQKNIRVDAEAGASNWGEAPNTTNAPHIMTFVAAYNQSHAIKFGGVQFDVEPYLLPQYNTNESGVLTDYVNLVANLASQDADENLPLTIIVPDFYTASMQWTPEVTVGGVTNYTYEQILRLLSPLSGSRIIVMACRNFAAGSDGTIDLSQSEVTEADTTNVKVLVAQETGPVTPAYVTFYGMTRSELAGQVAVINQTFDSDKSFAGISIDYLVPFLNLP